jgi:hypothetical protein
VLLHNSYIYDHLMCTDSSKKVEIARTAFTLMNTPSQLFLYRERIRAVANVCPSQLVCSCILPAVFASHIMHLSNARPTWLFWSSQQRAKSLPSAWLIAAPRLCLKQLCSSSLILLHLLSPLPPLQHLLRADIRCDSLALFKGSWDQACDCGHDQSRCHEN